MFKVRQSNVEEQQGRSVEGGSRTSLDLRTIDSLATLSGGVGTDHLEGGNGADVISGGDGADILIGGNGSDVLYGYGAEDQDPLSGAITADLFANRLPPPVFLVSPPGSPNLLFVATLPGLIFVYDISGSNPVKLGAPALALPFQAGQQLLGFTFHPDYADNGRVFIHYTSATGTQRISDSRRSTATPSTQHRSGC